MANKRRVSYYFSEETIARMDNLPRTKLHNKSELIEQLVCDWLDKVETEWLTNQEQHKAAPQHP